jgi:ribosome-associated protein
MKDNLTVREKALKPNQGGERAVLSQGTKTTEFAELDERMQLALAAASDKKAIETVALDLRDIATFTDYFIITSGSNQRQVQAISDEIADRLKKAGTPAARIEGYQTAEWILLDYGDFIVHVFSDKSRAFYDLERLWRDGIRVQLPADLAGESASSLRREL